VRFSAFPINVVRGTDLNGDGINNDRPPFRGRNDTPGYGLKEVNLRISRTFRFYERYSLELIREAENLLNSTNAAMHDRRMYGRSSQHGQCSRFQAHHVCT
jgi:hypothetical protein